MLVLEEGKRIPELLVIWMCHKCHLSRIAAAICWDSSKLGVNIESDRTDTKDLNDEVYRMIRSMIVHFTTNYSSRCS